MTECNHRSSYLFIVGGTSLKATYLSAEDGKPVR